VQVVGEGATEESDATEPFDVENDVTLRQRVTCARAGRELRPCDLVSTDTKNDIFASHLAESTAIQRPLRARRLSGKPPHFAHGRTRVTTQRRFIPPMQIKWTYRGSVA